MGPRLQGHLQRQHVPQGRPRPEHALYARRAPRRTAPQPPLGRSLRPARLVPVGPAAKVRRTRHGRPPVGVSRSCSNPCVSGRCRPRRCAACASSATPTTSAWRRSYAIAIRPTSTCRSRTATSWCRTPTTAACWGPRTWGSSRRHQRRGHQGAGLPHVGQPAVQSRQRRGALAQGRRMRQGGDGFQR